MLKFIAFAGLAVGAFLLRTPKDVTVSDLYRLSTPHGQYRLEQVEVTDHGSTVTLSDGRSAITAYGDIPNGKRHTGNAVVQRQGDAWVLTRWTPTVLSAMCGVPTELKEKNGELGVMVEGHGWVRFNSQTGVFDH